MSLNPENMKKRKIRVQPILSKRSARSSTEELPPKILNEKNAKTKETSELFVALTSLQYDQKNKSPGLAKVKETKSGEIMTKTPSPKSESNETNEEDRKQRITRSIASAIEDEKNTKRITRSQSSSSSTKSLKKGVTPTKPKKLKKITQSPSDIARQYDKERNIFPEAGPSRNSYYIPSPSPKQTRSVRIPSPASSENNFSCLNYYQPSVTSLSGQKSDINIQEKTPIKSPQIVNSEESRTNYFDRTITPNRDILKDFAMSPEVSENLMLVDEESERENQNYGDSDNDCDNFDRNICSFYDKTIIFESPPSPFTYAAEEKGNTSFEFSQMSLSNSFKSVHNESDPKTYRITPKSLPPNPSEIIESMKVFEIPEIIQIEPFFSNIHDVTSKKEVGHSVLRVTEKGACDEFVSSIDNVKGLNHFRREFVKLTMSNEKTITNIKQIREFFSTEKRMKIAPVINPPTHQDAKEWYEGYLETKKVETIEPEKPVRRTKLIMINNNCGSDDDNSDMELTLSPLTPNSINEIDKLRPNSVQGSTNSKNNGTNVTILDKVNTSNSPQVKPKARLSLTKRFNEIKKQNIRNSMNKQIIEVQNVSQDSSEFFMCGQRFSQSSDSSNNTVVSSENSSFITSLLGLNKNKRHQLSLDSSDMDRSCEISAATLDNTHGFKMNLENFNSVKTDIEVSLM